MHLVDDIDLILAYLWGNVYLLHQLADVVNGIVGGSIQLEDVVRALLVECSTRLTLVACLPVFARIQTVDGLGKDTRTGGLSHASRSAEEVGLCQFPCGDGVFQRGDERLLTHYRLESGGAIFSCRYNIVFHKSSFQC